MHPKALYIIPYLCCAYSFIASAQEKIYTKEEYQSAIEYSTKKLQEDSLLNSEHFKIRAQAYYALENLDSALKDFNSYLRLNGQDSYTFYNRGTLKNILGQFEGALQDFSRAIEFSIDNPADFYFARGAVYQTLKSILKQYPTIKLQLNIILNMRTPSIT